MAVCILIYQPLGACQICLPFPTRSIADDLVEADYVALARENPDKPFTLSLTRILKGDGSPPPIDLFLDSQSRQVLANDPNKSAVCVYLSNEPEATWRRITIDGPTITTLIAETLDLATEWKAHPEARQRYFSALLSDDDPQIATLAHLEVARAPYSEIRALAGTIPVQEIRDFLADFRMAEWHALYILLLAQSEDPIDRQRIEEAAHSNADYSITLQTAAWATAYIEIAETEALDFFDKHYLTDQNRSDEELRAILAAYSVHGTNGHIHLQDRIVDSYHTLADLRPDFLPILTADLEKWRNWELADNVNAVLSESPETIDLESTLHLRNYLRAAGASQRSDPEASGSRTPGLILAGILLLLPLAIKILGRRKA